MAPLNPSHRGPRLLAIVDTGEAGWNLKNPHFGLISAFFGGRLRGSPSQFCDAALRIRKGCFLLSRALSSEDFHVRLPDLDGGALCLL